MLELENATPLNAKRGLLPWADPYVAQLFTGTLHRDGKDREHFSVDYSTIQYSDADTLRAEISPPVFDPLPDFESPSYRTILEEQGDEE